MTILNYNDCKARIKEASDYIAFKEKEKISRAKQKYQILLVHLMQHIEDSIRDFSRTNPYWAEFEFNTMHYEELKGKSQDELLKIFSKLSDILKEHGWFEVRFTFIHKKVKRFHYLNRFFSRFKKDFDILMEVKLSK